MHELSICEAVLRQVLTIAADSDQLHVGRITLRIGPLAGVEPDLLLTAFPLVAAGTACERATIVIEEHRRSQVRCRLCRAVSEVRPNRLLCAQCGAWRVNVLTGDEMMLAKVELLEMPFCQQQGNGRCVMYAAVPAAKIISMSGMPSCRLAAGRQVEVLQALLHDNDHQAAHNRAHFDAAGVLVVNLMSSPGAGKTRLLEATIHALNGAPRGAADGRGDRGRSGNRK